MLCHECFNAELIGSKHNGRAGFREIVGSGGSIRNGSLNGHAGVSFFPRDLAERLLFKIVGAAHAFAGLFAYHRLLSFHLRTPVNLNITTKRVSGTLFGLSLEKSEPAHIIIRK